MMLRTIFLSAPAHAALRQHCLSGDTRERVGLLVGTGDRVTAAVPLTNHARGTDSFFIRGADIRRVRAAVAPEVIVGRYHTHPASRIGPSREDRASLPDGWIELIVTVAQPLAGHGGTGPRIGGLYAYLRGGPVDVAA